MIWPFSKNKASSNIPDILPLKDGQSFFEYWCKYGSNEVKENTGAIALVLDAQKECNAPVAIKIENDGSQLAMLRVAADDGGFVVMAYTPSGKGSRLKPGDVVIWVPNIYKDEVAKGFGDQRAGWVGFIRARVAPEISIKSPSWNILERYD